MRKAFRKSSIYSRLSTWNPCPSTGKGEGGGLLTGGESHLHKSLKEWYLEDGDICEARVGDIVADILRPRKRGKSLIIEVQTGSFSKLVPKLPALLGSYRVRVLLPLAAGRRIVLYAEDQKKIMRSRTSPRHDNIYAIFNELIRIPEFLKHPCFEFEAVFTMQEEIRIADGKGSWRRKGISIQEKRLVEIIRTEEFHALSDYARLIPADLHEGFTCSRFAAAAGCTKKLAQKTAYCLSRAGLLDLAGKEGREHLYTLNM